MAPSTQKSWLPLGELSDSGHPRRTECCLADERCHWYWARFLHIIRLGQKIILKCVVVVVVVARRYALGFNIKMKDLNMSDDGTDGTGDDKEIS